ncbi:MAG TPA: right-handed parallel beta-helix repeat-containing protein [Cyclobacteriaceae bacterium]|nr:right-handed parallel beta-helix repeat-containing protein [Cyclobacteriaceae bacterium]
MKSGKESRFKAAACFTIGMSFVMVQCLDPELTVTSGINNSELIPAGTTSNLMVSGSNCPRCTYTVPGEATNIDGAVLNLKPGDVICLDAAIKYGPLRFINLRGDEGSPITITNCGGKVFMDETPDAPYAIKILDSRYFRVTGGDSTGASNTYGIRMTGSQLGLSMDYLTTNFEVDHIEVGYVGFAGIMAKTDPSCNDSTVRGAFTSKAISIHDNFVHFTGGEGLYIGNSFYENGVELPCGVRMPQAIEGVKLYNNLLQFTGRDGIQLGAAVQGADIFSNKIQYFGTTGEYEQNSGIQIGEGTGGRCFNNFIKDGSGNGITVLGLGGNVVQSNVIINAGASGIFCDDRYTPGPSFTFTDNIILNPTGDGIRLYSEKIPMNYVIHNLIVNPGNYWRYSEEDQGDDEQGGNGQGGNGENGNSQGGNNSGGNGGGQGNSSVMGNVPALTGNDAYVFKWSRNVKLTESSNVFTTNTNTVRAAYVAAFHFDPINKSASHQPIKITSLLNISF